MISGLQFDGPYPRKPRTRPHYECKKFRDSISLHSKPGQSSHLRKDGTGAGTPIVSEHAGMLNGALMHACLHVSVCFCFYLFVVIWPKVTVPAPSIGVYLCFPSSLCLLLVHLGFFVREYRATAA